MAEYATVVKERRRMCKEVQNCSKCPLSAINNKTKMYCDILMSESPAEADRIIMQWAVEHPLVTNGAKFEEIFGVQFWDISCGVTPEISKWLRSEYKEAKK